MGYEFKGSLLLQVERIMTLEVSHFLNYGFLLIILPFLELIKNKWSVRHAFLNNKEKKAYTRPFITTYGMEGYIWLQVYVESHDPFPFGSKNRT